MKSPVTVQEFQTLGGRFTYLHCPPELGNRIITIAYYRPKESSIFFYGGTVFNPEGKEVFTVHTRQASRKTAMARLFTCPVSFTYYGETKDFKNFLYSQVVQDNKYKVRGVRISDPGYHLLNTMKAEHPTE